MGICIYNMIFSNFDFELFVYHLIHMNGYDPRFCKATLRVCNSNSNSRSLPQILRILIASLKTIARLIVEAWELFPPSPDDIFEICYTSGTTGKPKGAVYHHNRMIAEATALRRFIKDNLQDSIFEVFLCYLPLAHSYELAIECFCLLYGYKMGYFNGNPRKILEDIQVLQPTILAAVPRVLSRIHEGIEKKTSRQEAGVVRSVLFKLALRQKINAINKGINKETAVFVGSSSTHPSTIQMLRATLGCHVCEGYGQTETYGVTFVQQPDDLSLKCIGAPLEHIQFKVVDVPDLHYFAKNSEGELCIRSPSTIQGYYKNPEETAKVVSEDNWIRTGDVVKINANGTVSIIDRIKEFFKLSQGEYVIPSKVESAYLECREIENIFVWGDPLKTCCVAVVFPEMDKLANSLKEAKINVDKSNYQKSKQVREHLLKVMEIAAVRNGLKGFEKAKNIYITTIPLVDYVNLLSPTMKIKRHAFVKHFEREIAIMYEGVVDKPF
ncbi:hypothetical protein GJ496_006824 [Pomphorhynchus laevis]|nr:hypothetical protein GJ496_006824 [Pomphorhynchus laevis]